MVRVEILANPFCVMRTIVVETHPDSIVDLRLDCPFPSLREYIDSWNLEAGSIDSMSLAHCPYVVILFKALEQFKSKSGKPMPETREEKQEFKDCIRRLKTVELKDPENFEEALSAAYRAYAPTRVS